jgi:DnaJ like chaperone protein
MSIWSRITEAVAAIGDSVMAFLQRVSGAVTTPPEKTIAFTIGMIALSAKMAKADGTVMEAEVAAFKQVFHVPDDELPAVARIFNLAKQDVAGFDVYARQVARLFEAKSPVLVDVLDGLFHIACADGELHPAELQFLREVAAIFGFDGKDFEAIAARYGKRPDETDPWRVLGLERGVPFAAVRQRYRQLVRENHPDRHMAAGVPLEMVSLATERLKAINAAYARIESQMREPAQ